MADTFHTAAARVMPAVQQMYSTDPYGYGDGLGYGMPEYVAAQDAARVAASRIGDYATREEALSLARLFAADLLLQHGYSPKHAGREALRRAWLISAPSHTGQDAAPEQAVTLQELQELETAAAQDGRPFGSGQRPALTDAAYATRTRDLAGYALQSLPATEYALVAAYMASDAYQQSRLPTQAIARRVKQDAPHIAAELGLTEDALTGRRAVKFAAQVRDALQVAADAYTDSLTHNVWDSRNRAARPAPRLYVLPERTGYAGSTPSGSGHVAPAAPIRTPQRIIPAAPQMLSPLLRGYERMQIIGYSATEQERGYPLQLDLAVYDARDPFKYGTRGATARPSGWPMSAAVAVPLVSLVKTPRTVRTDPAARSERYAATAPRKRSTMSPEWRGTGKREQAAADHAAYSSSASSTARPIAGVTPGIAYGNAIAGSGTAQRVQASRRRKRDGGIGSPMTRG